MEYSLGTKFTSTNTLSNGESLFAWKDEECGLETWWKTLKAISGLKNGNLILRAFAGRNKFFDTTDLREFNKCCWVKIILLFMIILEMDSACLGSQPRLNLQYFQLGKLSVYHLGSFCMESVRKDIVNIQMLFWVTVLKDQIKAFESHLMVFFSEACVSKGLWVKVIASYNHCNPDPHGLQLENSRFMGLHLKYCKNCFSELNFVMFEDSVLVCSSFIPMDRKEKKNQVISLQLRMNTYMGSITDENNETQRWITDTIWKQLYELRFKTSSNVMLRMRKPKTF